MSTLWKGLIVAALHLALVASLGAKLLYDRHTRPRVWAQTVPYDPDLPIRGRYLSLQLIVQAEGFEAPRIRGDLNRWDYDERRARLEPRDGRLVAIHDSEGEFTIRFVAAPGARVPPTPKDMEWADAQKLPIDYPLVTVLQEPVLFFIPEHAEDPTPRLGDSKELWAEVTLPKKGQPRPIQLALKKDGKWMPLELR